MELPVEDSPYLLTFFAHNPAYNHVLVPNEDIES